MNYKLFFINLLLLECISLVSYFHLSTYIFLCMANKNDIFDLKVKNKILLVLKNVTLGCNLKIGSFSENISYG